MQNIKLTEKRVFKEEIGTSLIETSRLLADFFNGVVVGVEEEYEHES